MTVDAELPSGVPGIDVPRLAEWLARELPGLPGSGRITAIDLIAGGRSNLTYGITLDGGRRVVLRRPPLGHVLPTAHDMGREYRVLTALGDRTSVPVPRTLAFCDDEDVIGARFYLMDFVEGRVLRTREDAADITPEQARGLSEALAEALAAIHTVDLKAAGLEDFGRPSGYMERQLRRWRKQWDGSQEAIRATGVTRDLPEYDRLVERLAGRMPADAPARLVHGDFRLDNALARVEPRPEIAAVVDWEMSTLGDPLTDLALFLLYGDEAIDLDSEEKGEMANPEEIVAHYAEATGRDVSRLGWYLGLACFKLAVIAEGIHFRYTQGLTVGEGFAEIGEHVGRLVARGLTEV